MVLDFSANITNHFGIDMFVMKKGILFIKRDGKWLNTRLEVMANGGGLKGVLRFLWGLLKCYMGKHTYSNIFYLKRMMAKRECHYCRKENNEY